MFAGRPRKRWHAAPRPARLGKARPAPLKKTVPFARARRRSSAEDAPAFSATQRPASACAPSATAALSSRPASAPLTASSKEKSSGPQPSTRRQSFGVFSQTVASSPSPRCRKKSSSVCFSAVSPPR